MDLVERLESYDIGFKSATESFDTTTSSGKLMFQQLGSFAEFERNRIAERVFPGMVKGVKKGRWQGARYSPFGYSYNKEKKLLEVEEREADIVKLIYKMYLEDRGIQGIANYLNKKGYKTRTGKRFYTKFISDVLKNKIYIGKLVWNKHHYDKNKKTKKHYKYVKNDPSEFIEAEGKHKAIIDKEDFEKVQEKIKNRKRGWRRRVKKSNYLLSGLLYCDKCNHKYLGSLAISNHRTNKKKRWYRCSGPHKNNIKCNNRNVKAEDIEPEVTKVIANLAENERLKQSRWLNVTFDKSAKKANFPNFHEKGENNSVDIKNKQKDNQEKQSKLTDAYLENLLGKEVYSAKMKELRAEEVFDKVDILSKQPSIKLTN